MFSPTALDVNKSVVDYEKGSVPEAAAVDVLAVCAHSVACTSRQIERILYASTLGMCLPHESS